MDLGLIKFENNYSQPDLSQYQYKIGFTQTNIINLDDNLISNILPSFYTNPDLADKNYIFKLITEYQSIRNQILNISSKDADKITSDVLRYGSFIYFRFWS